MSAGRSLSRSVWGIFGAADRDNFAASSGLSSSDSTLACPISSSQRKRGTSCTSALTRSLAPVPARAHDRRR